MNEAKRTEKPKGEIGLSSYLSRRLLPITTGVGLLISVVFPLTFFRLEHRRLEQQAEIYADNLGTKFTSHLVLYAPSLWKYQTYKHTQIIEDLVANTNISGIRVFDENGKEIEGYTYVNPSLKWWQKHVLSSSAPIRFNNRDIGRVEINVSEGEIMLEAFVLFLISTVFGAGLAFGGYEFPVRVVRRMEADIERLIASVRSANEESERLRAIAEASARELEEAYEELKHSEAKIMQHEKLVSIGHLAAGVAHEINNPLAFVSSNLAVLQDYGMWLREYLHAQEAVLQEEGNATRLGQLAETRRRLNVDFILADLDQLLTQTVDGTERVQKTVQELKGFAASDEDKKAANLNDCLDSTIRLVQNQLSRKADIVTEYGELPVVKCYPQQLNQVFMNLLINAGHAITGRGTIRVSTYCKCDSICISVSDTGCGIPPEIARKIFEPFFTTREAGKGTGLGLSISSDIVKKHGGVISVDSEIGKGSTFTITIPFAHD